MGLFRLWISASDRKPCPIPCRCIMSGANSVTREDILLDNQAKLHGGLRRDRYKRIGKESMYGRLQPVKMFIQPVGAMTCESVLVLYWTSIRQSTFICFNCLKRRCAERAAPPVCSNVLKISTFTGELLFLLPASPNHRQDEDQNLKVSWHNNFPGSGI